MAYLAVYATSIKIKPESWLKVQLQKVPTSLYTQAFCILQNWND
jgi:hypothetical protein